MSDDQFALIACFAALFVSALVMTASYPLGRLLRGSRDSEPAPSPVKPMHTKTSADGEDTDVRRAA